MSLREATTSPPAAPTRTLSAALAQQRGPAQPHAHGLRFASLEGQWGKAPRIDKTALRYGARPHRFHRLPVVGGPDPPAPVGRGLRTAEELQDIFGKEFFYAELMDHGLEIEQRVTRTCCAWPARRRCWPQRLPHVRPGPHRPGAMLTSAGVLSPDRFKFDGDTYYLRPGSEMRRLFSSFRRNTLLVAEQCDVHFRTVDEVPPSRRPSPSRGRDRWKSGSSRSAGAAWTAGSTMTSPRTAWQAGTNQRHHPDGIPVLPRHY